MHGLKVITEHTVAAALAPLAETPERATALAPQMDRIRQLALERDAIILAHNYQRPEILLVADRVVDSLELAQWAHETPHARILFAGVHFMAETAKVLNPEKVVLLPNRAAGCSLADMADAEDVMERVRELRELHPNLGVVSYVNTTAAVKALSDVCCTSSNAVRIVERLDRDPIPFLPDRNLAAYVAEQTGKRIIAWQGNCYVHEQITPEQIARYRRGIPGIVILAHPECRKDVQLLADEVCSTSQMVARAKVRPERVFLIVTECGLSDRLLMEVPEKRFLKSCNLCGFMKMNTLDDLEHALRTDQHRIELDVSVADGARRALERMLAWS